MRTCVYDEKKKERLHKLIFVELNRGQIKMNMGRLHSFGLNYDICLVFLEWHGHPTFLPYDENIL